MSCFLPAAPVSLSLLVCGLAMSLVAGFYGASPSSGVAPALVSAATGAVVITPPESAVLPLHLSDTGLYADVALQKVRGDHQAYSPQYPLWTDGARKRRWLYLPPGSFIDATDADAWVFPIGTRVWKEFSFAGRRVETRYMERLQDGSWRYATYVWNRDGADAVLAPKRGVPDATQIASGVSHAVPGEGECHACHGGAASPVLGFSALQLSSDRDPLALHGEDLPSGAVDLSSLLERGLLRGLSARLVANPPRIDTASPLERAALGYLHGNCGSCHNDSGPLASLAMSLAHSLEKDGTPVARQTTVNRSSRFRLPSAPAEPALRVVPGLAEKSVLAARMRSRNPLLQMPPMGTRLVDQAAVELIDQWINQCTEETEI